MFNSIRSLIVLSLLISPFAASAAPPAKVDSNHVIDDGDWPWWRGLNSNGVAVTGQKVPNEWSETRNVLWRAPIPGRGHSSPIVVGQRVLLTTADEKRQIQSVVCYDRATGRQLWKTDVSQGGFPPKIHSKNTHATPTIACDGQRVFALFCNHDSAQLTALALDGRQLWQKNVGAYRPRAYKYGFAPSPLVYKSFVIVASEFEGGYLVAVARATGDQAWRTARPKMVSYSSPIVAKVAGRDQLLISGCGVVSSYDPDNGRLSWTCPGPAKATCGTMVWDGDLAFASGGYPEKQTMAIRADGSGEVVWRNREKCYEQSLLVHDGHVFAVDDNGIALCWNARSGEQMWKTRLGGPVSASPILAAGNIYAANERGTTFVFRADPKEFKLLAKNQLGDESFATPTICGNQIFLRVAARKESGRQETLYCLALEK